MSENIRENNRREGGRIRRADICLMAFLMLLAFGSFVWFAVSRKDGQVLRISCDGQVVVNVPLSQILPQKTAGEDDGETVRFCLILYPEEGVSCEWYEADFDLASMVPAGSSYNLLASDGERIWMEAADCRDQICVHHIPIAGGGESIICLPHRLAVEIVGGADEETLDGVAETEKADGMVWNKGRRSYETNG